MKNLWPDNLSQKTHKITPKEFLSQQMELLSKSTNGKLHATLRTDTVQALMDNITSDDFSGELFIHSMKVKSPSLGFSFALLRLAHHTLRMFPFVIYSNLTDEKFTGKNIEDMEEILTEIFTSKEVTEALTSLVTQSED